MKKLICNFLYNNINTILKVVYPILTYPYIVRVLGVEKIGVLELSMSMTSCLIILASLGIPIYGIREVSRVREKREKLSKIVLELLLINIFSTFILLVLYYFFVILYYKNIKTFLFILSLNIILAPLGIEWFYQGIEEYKYITTRNFIFQILSIFFIYIFIKKPEDFMKYLYIIVFQSIGSNILNMLNCLKYISISKQIITGLSFLKHFKTILITCVMRIASTIYIYIDSIMLGKIIGVEEVGYYSIGVKLIKIIVLIGASLGTVLMPRINNNKEKKREYVNNLLELLINYIYLYSIPFIIGSLIIGDRIIIELFGDKFIPSILILKIVSPILLIMLLSNFMGVNILFINNEDIKMMFSIVLGAIINFSLNFILIPKYGGIGAAISTLIAETTIFITQYIFGKKYLEKKLLNKNLIKIIFSSLVMGGVCYLLKNKNIYFNIFFSIYMYFFMLIIFKENLILKILYKMKVHIKKFIKK